MHRLRWGDQGLGRPLVVVAIVAIVAIVVWLVMRGPDGGGDGQATTGGRTVGGTTTFSDPRVPFTFDYPDHFAPGRATPGIVWVAGVSPVDILDVRRVADREFSVQGLRTVYSRTLQEQAGVDVLAQDARSVAGMQVVIFDVVTDTDVRLRSRLVYLSAAGATWQVECQASADDTTEIDSACDLMLSTLAPS